MKIKSKFKFIRGILILIAIVSLFICKSIFSFNKENYKTIYVTNGETLWEIARNEQQTNDYYKEKDIREIVYSIKTINNLSDCNLHEGQELRVLN